MAGEGPRDRSEPRSGPPAGSRQQMKHRLLEEKGRAGGPARPFLLAVTDGRQKGNESI